MSLSEKSYVELWHRTLLAQDYGLINPLQVEASLWSDLHTIALVPDGLESRAGLMPRLADLQAMSNDARVELLDRMDDHARHSNRPFFSALIVSDRDHKSLADGLTARLVVKDPAGRAALLRYHDPAVFTHLRWLLTSAQLDRLLHSIHAWTWRDAKKTWRQTRPEGNAVSGRLQLQPSQWDALNRIGMLNGCLKNLAKQSETFDVTGVSTAQRIDSFLAQAHSRHGLTDRAARMLYAEQAMRFDLDIHRHPEMAQRLAQRDFVGACADLDDDAMQRLVETLHDPEKVQS